MAGSRREVLQSALCVIFVMFTFSLAYEMGMLPQAHMGLPSASAALLADRPAAQLVAAATETLHALTEATRTPSRPAELAKARVENVSVIMPCFGHSAYLEEALASVVHQQYPPAEIIVVDDSDPNRCGELVRSHSLAARLPISTIENLQWPPALAHPCRAVLALRRGRLSVGLRH